MINKQRGEVKIQGPEGEDLKMCSTMGAIVQIEEDLKIESLTGVGELFQNPSMSKMMVLIKALLAGGGNPLTKEAMMTWQLDFEEVMEKITECFKLAGFGGEELGEGKDSEGK